MNSNSMFHFIKHLSLWLNICYKATHLEITITTELFSYWKARDGENIYCGKTSLPIVLWTHPHKKSDHKRKNGYIEKKLLTFSSMCKCLSWMSFLNVLEFLHLKMHCNNLTNSSFWLIIFDGKWTGYLYSEMFSETEESVFYTNEIEIQALGSVLQSPDSAHAQLVLCSHNIAFMHA